MYYLYTKNVVQISWLKLKSYYAIFDAEMPMSYRIDETKLAKTSQNVYQCTIYLSIVKQKHFTNYFCGGTHCL